ncbi:thioredoxin family protein [Flammeovirgaceae bacterium SG7u.111]|nr:thioredoxin family protein [Flammeovirgaceae bacterium SG7u.132]WPO33770.1 thioredoxin family protein [Flammeovirgaceae bacterium SG7u.111]
MSATPSTMIPLGSTAPDFTLPDTVSGKDIALSELQPEVATVIIFICNHCPYVIHIAPKFAELAKAYQAKGVKFVAISSNDVVNYPQDSPEKMTEFAKEYDLSFPYLYDESQEVAKAYKAACTPDLFVFDKDLKCTYRGQFDASRPKNVLPVTGEDLINALDLMLDGKAVPETQIPSIGCNIKWKA